MSRIPRKKSRPIVVDGKTFRWMLKGRSRYIGDTPRSLRLIVQEDEETPGRPLIIGLTSKHWTVDMTEGLESHRASVIPSNVVQIVRTSLESGWDPSEKGAPFIPALELEFEDFVCDVP